MLSDSEVIFFSTVIKTKIRHTYKTHNVFRFLNSSPKSSEFGKNRQNSEKSVMGVFFLISDHFQVEIMKTWRVLESESAKSTLR